MYFVDEIKIDGITLTVRIGEIFTTIFNSFKIRNVKSMKAVLEILTTKYPQKELSINKLTIDEMITEWKAHNILCSMKISPFKSCNLDVNIDNKWYHKLGYNVLSIFYINRKNDNESPYFEVK